MKFSRLFTILLSVLTVLLVCQDVDQKGAPRSDMAVDNERAVRYPPLSPRASACHTCVPQLR